MNRLCIYVTYNQQNKIQEYIGYMLKSLRNCVTTLYVVCNYSKILKGEEYIESYVDEIFYRENVGYDAGAYKDMLCDTLGWDKIYQYDELILINDSSFGPFYDLGKYIDMMEKQSCDFWGMTRNRGGRLHSIGYTYGSHIQSYFLGFNKNVLTSLAFKSFWEQLIYPQTFLETVVNFELAINKHLEDHGFVSMALSDVLGMTFQEHEILYLTYALELVKDKSFPIMKKKSLLIRNPWFENALHAVLFLKNNNSYPAKWIWDIIDSQFYIEGYAPEGQNSLEFFYNKYRKIYIYGAGICGKSLRLYFEHKGWHLEGLIVTNMEGQDTDCIPFKDVNIDDETGIIVSVIQESVSNEIVKYVEKRCSKEQLFIIYDCKAIRAPEWLTR